MQKNNVHEALYLNLEIMITWSEVQTIAMGQYDHIVNTFTNLQLIFYLYFHNHVRKIKNIVVMSMKASF